MPRRSRNNFSVVSEYGTWLSSMVRASASTRNASASWRLRCRRRHSSSHFRGAAGRPPSSRPRRGLCQVARQVSCFLRFWHGHVTSTLARQGWSSLQAVDRVRSASTSRACPVYVLGMPTGWRVALIGARMLARYLPGPPAGLGAMGPIDIGILALARCMAGLGAQMVSTLERLPTLAPAEDVPDPARLVLPDILPAKTWLLDQIHARRTGNVVLVTLMRNFGMPAGPLTRAVVVAFGGPCPTGLRRHEDTSSARAANLVEDGLEARGARTPVA